MEFASHTGVSNYIDCVISAKETIAEGSEGTLLESSKARLSKLGQRKSKLEITILQEQIRKPFLKVEI